MLQQMQHQDSWTKGVGGSITVKAHHQSGTCIKLYDLVIRMDNHVSGTKRIISTMYDINSDKPEGHFAIHFTR